CCQGVVLDWSRGGEPLFEPLLRPHCFPCHSVHQPGTQPGLTPCPCKHWVRRQGLLLDDPGSQGSTLEDFVLCLVKVVRFQADRVSEDGSKIEYLWGIALDQQCGFSFIGGGDQEKR